MDRIFDAAEAHTKAFAGIHSQVPMAMLGEAQPTLVLAEALLARITFNGALNESAKHSGKDDQKIAEEIHISQAYMSRAMRGVWQQWARRLVAFMHKTNSRAPLQWLAHQVGCEVVAKDRQAAEVAWLRAQLAARGEAA